MRRFGIEIEAFLKASNRIGHEYSAQNYVAQKLAEAGIQCFAEGYNHETRGHWKVVSDSSVKNELGDWCGCFELVSPPMADFEQLKTVCNVLEQIATANKSCGLHVHVDAANLSAEQAKVVLFRYAENENKIDAFMPESRRSNLFCQSVANAARNATVRSAQTWREFADAIPFSQLGPRRYYKLNVQSYLVHGTIEFRQHSGTVEFEKISNWVKFVQNFVETTVQASAVESSEGFVGRGKTATLRTILSDGQDHSLEELGAATNYTIKEVRAALSSLRSYKKPFNTVVTGGMVRMIRSMRSAELSDIFAGLENSVREYFTNRAARFAALPVAA